MSPEELAEEEKKIGAISNLGKITIAGYTSLDVRFLTTIYFALAFLVPGWPLSDLLILCDLAACGIKADIWRLAHSLLHLWT
jgi:hypothetical protein